MQTLIPRVHCVPASVLSALRVLFYLHPMRVLSGKHFYPYLSGTERLRNLPEVTQLMSRFVPGIQPGSRVCVPDASARDSLMSAGRMGAQVLLQVAVSM